MLRVQGLGFKRSEVGYELGFGCSEVEGFTSWPRGQGRLHPWLCLASSVNRIQGVYAII